MSTTLLQKLARDASELGVTKMLWFVTYGAYPSWFNNRDTAMNFARNVKSNNPDFKVTVESYVLTSKHEVTNV